MKKQIRSIVSVIGLFSLCFTACSVEHKEVPLTLWYNTPADATATDNPNKGYDDDAEWLKALPLGNGSLGAMVFGDVHKERIQLNEETMWSGSIQDSDNPEAAKHIEEIKQLLFDGKYKEATDLTNRTQICTGKGSGHGQGSNAPFGCYQTMGDLWIDFDNKSPYTDYRRELNLDDATARISYKQGDVNFKREIFISHPDQSMVMRISADKKQQLSFTCRMNRPERYSTYTENEQLIMAGALSDGKGGDGLQYMTRLKAVPMNGSVTYSDSTLTVKDADEVLLFLTASTDYKLEYPIYKGRDFSSITEASLNKAINKSYNQLYETHVKEYTDYFQRANLQLTNTPDTIPTDIKVMNARKGMIDPHLYEQMFQYGRYLLISSSRPGTMPANLQGIWANKLQTAWNGDYHTDVNIEMNYWPAEVTNLSEMHLPMFDLIASLVEPGSKTAQIQYNKKGWVVHPITNVWGYTSPGEAASWGMHTGAPAWICQHIGEHYRFTGDKDFLRKTYPVLKGAIEFYMDWLTENPKTKELVSGPAVSPENTFVAPDGSHSQISMGPAHDQQTIWQLFDDFAMISSELSIDDDFTRQVADAKDRLADTKIGSDGRIMEWADEFPEVEPGHRHISHLFAIHPGSQINMLQTPDLIEAANKSLDYRIQHRRGYVSWSSAWAISQYARLHQAEKAKENLDDVMKKCINPNLFTICPPFQIDANFGTTAGIAEMLLQSHVYDQGGYIIQLLPSLPADWKKGEFSGLKARGGFEVAVKWENGQIVDASVKSLQGNKFRIWYNGNYLQANGLKKGEIWKWNK